MIFLVVPLRRVAPNTSEQRSRSSLCEGVIRREATETEGLVLYITVAPLPEVVQKSRMVCFVKFKLPLIVEYNRNTRILKLLVVSKIRNYRKL